MVLNETVSALRFLYLVTLGRDWRIPVGIYPYNSLAIAGQPHLIIRGSPATQ
jgi:hypothetical protein